MKRLLFGLVLFVSCYACADNKSLNTPKSEGMIVQDSLPAEFMRQSFWVVFWEKHQHEWNGVTFCYGRNKSFSSIAPNISIAKADSTYRHEITHQKQHEKFGCEFFKTFYFTPVGMLKSELEAFNAEGIKNESQLYYLLTAYDTIAKLPHDSIFKLIRRYNGNVHW